MEKMLVRGTKRLYVGTNQTPCVLRIYMYMLTRVSFPPVSYLYVYTDFSLCSVRASEVRTSYIKTNDGALVSSYILLYLINMIFLYTPKRSEGLFFRPPRTCTCMLYTCMEVWRLFWISSRVHVYNTTRTTIIYCTRS